MKKGHKLRKVLSIILIVIVTIALLTTVVNVGVVKSAIKKAESYSQVEIDAQLVPEKDKNGNWVFTTDRDFRVLQLTDVHLGGGYASFNKDKMTLNAVATMVTKEKPDLVIVTGDIAYPVPFFANTFNNKSGAREFAALMEKLGVYWTVTLGNHDSEMYSFYNRDKVSRFYADGDFKYCLFQRGPEDVDGYCNHVIEVKNSKGIITQGFVMIDSHSYTDGDYFGLKWRYDNIHANQVEWYKNEINRMNTENAEAISKLKGEEKEDAQEKFGIVKTLAFYHIPLVETREAWLEFEENNFKDTENVKYIDGIIGETGKRVYCGTGEDDFFETMVELGSTKGTFFGHDHYNSATLNYKGIIFSYGYSIDYLAYIGIAKNGSQRGCTVISVKPSGLFDIDKYNYYSDRYDLEGFEREEVTMQFKDIEYETPAKE